MEEFLKSLGLGDFRKTEDGKYVIDLKNSNEYGKAYSKLDRSDAVEEDSEISSINYESSNITFTNDKYVISLIGDFDGDIYKIVASEK